MSLRINPIKSHYIFLLLSIFFPIIPNIKGTFLSCPKGFYQDPYTNLCNPFKQLGQKCTSKQECEKNQYHTCLEGKCNCDPAVSILNTEPYSLYHQDPRLTLHIPSGICVGKVNTSCSFSSFDKSQPALCINTAYCVGDFKTNPVSLETYTQGICRCKEEYSETLNRMCGLNYGMACSAKLFPSRVCKDSLRCTGEQEDPIFDRILKCNCENPHLQEYDKFHKVCKGLIGSPCSSNDSSSPHGCTLHGICIQQDNIFQCECQEGYVENAHNKCEIAHGFECDYEYDYKGICDTAAKLKCIENKCSCTNKVDIYEYQRRQCSRPVGLMCTNNSDCVSNAFCLKLNDKLSGRCTCQIGFSLTEYQTCEYYR